VDGDLRVRDRGPDLPALNALAKEDERRADAAGPVRRYRCGVIRRLLAAAAAAVAVFAFCVLVSVVHRARVIAFVDGASVWTTLRTRYRLVLTAWRLSMETSDWLLFGAAAVAAGTLVAGGPLVIRFARSPRFTGYCAAVRRAATTRFRHKAR
jgi:hypothetical protein